MVFCQVSVAGIEQLASDLLPSRQFGHLVLRLGRSVVPLNRA